MSSYLWGVGGTLLGLVLGSRLADHAERQRLRRLRDALTVRISDPPPPTRAEITAGTTAESR